MSKLERLAEKVENWYYHGNHRDKITGRTLGFARFFVNMCRIDRWDRRLKYALGPPSRIFFTDKGWLSFLFNVSRPSAYSWHRGRALCHPPIDTDHFDKIELKNRKVKERYGITDKFYWQLANPEYVGYDLVKVCVKTVLFSVSLYAWCVAGSTSFNGCYYLYLVWGLVHLLAGFFGVVQAK